MEEEAPSRRSVAELAGRFKGPAPPHDAAGHETEKPVRRRPPRTLKLPKEDGDDQEALSGQLSTFPSTTTLMHLSPDQPSGITSLPGKAKRNSALIEKLQANLALSPTALHPSPKSPGFRLLPPAFPLPCHAADPVTTATTPSTATPTSPVAISPMTEEEGPTSFEDPPTVREGSILSSFNKGRARHSVRRRPPSRRHRKSSSGDDVMDEGADTLPADSNTTDVSGGGEEKTECPEGGEPHKEDQTKNAVELRGENDEEDEKKKQGEEKDEAGEEVKMDEETQGKQEEDQTQSTEDKEEKQREETTCRVQPDEELDVQSRLSDGDTGPCGGKAQERPESLDTKL